MVLHLMQSCFLVVVPAISLFFKVEMMMNIAAQAGSLEKQAMAAGFGLVGIPVILMAMWGVRTKNEVPVRFYGYYLLFCFVADLVVFVGNLVVHSPCGGVSKEGASFACGASRIFSSSSFSLMLGICVYLTFIVFSYAEELSLGAGPDLSDLVANAGSHRKHPVVGSHIMTTDLDNAKMYGTMMSSPTPIFGAGYHDTNFPPGYAPTGTCRQ